LKARTVTLVAIVSASTLIVGCAKLKSLVGGKPAGQVVASVNGEEITALELRAEMQGFSSRDPKVMKAAQQQVLEQIIMRNVLAQKAKEQKLDKTPDYALQVRRGEQTLLAQLYQRKLAAGVAVPTRAEAESFILAHPEMFAERKILIVDQIIAGPNKITPDRFKPLNSLDEVKALLNAEGVAYQENATTIDTLSTDPRIVAQLNNLPPGEVIVVPQRGALAFNHISETRSVPFRGDPAVTYAINVLRNQRAQQSVGSQMSTLRKGAESQITYNAAYKPAPPAPPAKAGAASAAGPAAPAAPNPAPAAAASTKP
jgi:EpsD family peptidyl-prolyl cis-trans isomerase